MNRHMRRAFLANERSAEHRSGAPARDELRAKAKASLVASGMTPEDAARYMEAREAQLKEDAVAAVRRRP